MPPQDYKTSFDFTSDFVKEDIKSYIPENTFADKWLRHAYVLLWKQCIDLSNPGITDKRTNGLKLMKRNKTGVLKLVTGIRTKLT